MRPTLERLAKDLSVLRVRDYVLQKFHADGCVDTTLVQNQPLSFLTESWSAAIAPKFTSFTVRRA
jgi:hypothetical protein